MYLLDLCTVHLDLMLIYQHLCSCGLMLRMHMMHVVAFSVMIFVWLYFDLPFYYSTAV